MRANALLAISLSCALVATTASPAFADVAQAKATLAAADKSAKAKDWASALTSYNAALADAGGGADGEAIASSALLGIAEARLGLGQLGEAHDAFDQWLRDHGAKAPAAKRTAAEKKKADLEQKTGTLVIEVNEPGASVVVDERTVGKSPLPRPVRVTPGPHRVRVTKDGFATFDQPPAANAGQATPVKVELRAESSKARLTVKEKGGKPVNVFVDGVDRGPAPWSGEVEAGQHEVIVRGTGLVSAPERIAVDRGKSDEVVLEAAASTATLKVSVDEGKGVIYLDGKVVGEGSFAAEIPSGKHTLEVSREGYDRFSDEIVLGPKETLSRTVTLHLKNEVLTGPVEKDQRLLEGFYGGVGLVGTIMPGGNGNTIQQTCDGGPRSGEVESCSSPTSNLGGGLSFYAGYHWNPVGVELAFGGLYDQSTPSVTFRAASLDPGLGPDPARTEEYGFRRIGGHGTVRVRLTVGGEKLRGSFAGGLGVSYRAAFVHRQSRTADGAEEAFLPDSVTYASPVLSFEPTAQYRLTPTFSLQAGLTLLIEGPRVFGGPPSTAPAGDRRFSNGAGITTPAYQPASGAQVYVGPFLGVQFGP